MLPYSIIVCGCTKNSSKYIYKHLELLYEIKNLFKEFKMVIYENDSTDNTIEILNNFKKTHFFFNYISENLNSSIRTHILAHGRNTLLKYTTGYDYMIMVDLDDVISTFKSSQIKYLFETTEWDALFANCLGKYYDIWALRIERDIWTPLCPWQVIDYDCWEMANKYKTTQVISQHQITLKTNNGLIPVTSAFGGFGIYKVNKIKGCSYIGIKNGKICCEHVEFHKQMIKNNARLFICPKFLVNIQNEHVI